MSYYTPTGKPLNQTRGLAAEVRTEFALIKTGLDTAEAAIAAAQSYAGAPAFSGTTNYTNGFVVYSIAGSISRLYRRNSAGTNATDPSADPTNWAPVVTGMVRVEVSTTTKTAVAGNDYWLENVALTAVTAPAAVDGARFAVTPANGLTTNTVDFGAATVRGPSGTATGVITIDNGLRLEVIYSSTLSKWVIQ